MAIDRDAEYLDGYADGRDGGGAVARFTGIGITETYRAGYRAGVEDRYQHGRRRDSENSESTNDSNETDSDDESAYSEATRESDFNSASSTYYTGSTSAHSTGAAISTGARDTFSEIIVIYIAYYSYVLPLLATLITIIHLGFIAGIHLATNLLSRIYCE